MGSKDRPFDLVGHSLAEVERELILSNLKAFGGNRERTAKVLGIGERTLYRKINQFKEEDKKAIEERDP
jgi:DNA-binding NtrC family response regulator